MAVAAVGQIVGIAVNVLKGLDILKNWFLPDQKHEEILRSFAKLSNQIDQVRDDIKNLEKMIKWEMTELQYGAVVGRIKLGMHYCLGIGKGITQAEKDNQERLKEVCANQSFTLALDALLDGMVGAGFFQKSILDNFYNETKGDRPKISALANRLQELICGGVIVLATYETVVRGKEGAKAMAERYSSRLKEVNAKVQSIIGRCVHNFQENMLNDLNEFLDSRHTNKDLVTKVSDFMSKKYDWLENFCLIYNDLHGFDKHCISGYRVNSLHRNGKCGIVYYRTKDEPPRFSHRYDEAYRINDETTCANAQEGCNNINAKLARSGIESIGCVVIRRGPDLWFTGNLSTRNATIVGPKATAIILLR